MIGRDGPRADVEDPAGENWLREYQSESFIHAKELGAALRVIDRDAENDGGQSRCAPSEIVAHWIPLDVGPEQAHTGSEQHLELGARVETGGCVPLLVDFRVTSEPTS